MNGVERVKVPFSQSEYQALLKLCEADLRPIDDEVRFAVREEAIRRGLLREGQREEDSR